MLYYYYMQLLLFLSLNLFQQRFNNASQGACTDTRSMDAVFVRYYEMISGASFHSALFGREQATRGYFASALGEFSEPTCMR